MFNRETPPSTVTLIALTIPSPLAINIYLPATVALTADLNTSPAIAGLTIGVYLATSALLQIFGGFLSDKYGRRPVTLWSLVLYTIASGLILWVTSIAQLLILRIIQAAGSVAITSSRAAVNDVSDAKTAASRMGYITVGMAVVPLFAPSIGGALTAYFNWRWIFVVCALVGLITWIIGYLDMGETLRKKPTSLTKQFRDYRQLLKSVRFWGYVMATSFGSGAFFSYLGGAPIVAIRDYGLTETTVGLYFAMTAFGYMTGNLLTGLNGGRLSNNQMIFLGLGLSTFAICISAILSILDLSSALTFFIAMSVVAVGNGMTIPNATAASMQINPDLAGSAAGLGSAFVLGIGAVLSTLATLILSNPAYGDRPLVVLMAVSVVLGLGSALMAHFREKRNAREAAQNA